MAVRRVSSSTTPYTTGLGVGVQSVTPRIAPWVRNRSWLTFTAPTTSEEKFIGLHAVWPESNYLALTASGNYTVDWGDGVVENFSSGVTAHHDYDFADTDLANTNAPVTLQGTANTITRSSHGYVNGDEVSLYNIVTTTGIASAARYFVIDATTNTFKISLTENGAAVDFTNDGTATLLPYKQAIVQVYPQAGQSLTALNLNLRHSSTTVAYTSGFLDIAVSGANITDLRIGAANPGTNTPNVFIAMLEQVNVVRTDCRQLGYLFNSCSGLRSVLGMATSAAPATTMAVTFTDSTDTVNATSHGFRNGDSVYFTSITSTTGITAAGTRYFVIGATTDTFQVSTTYGGTAVTLTTDGSGVAVRGTDMNNMFSSCTALESVSLFDTSSTVSMNTMFSSCRALKTVPLFNTSAVRYMLSMFQNCNALETVPLFNTAAVLSMDSMFFNCNALKDVPLFNTSSVVSMASMFRNCRAIVTVPLFNTAAVTTVSNMFNGCSALERVPPFNTSAVTDFFAMFASCTALRVGLPINASVATSLSSIYSGCFELQTVPAIINTSLVTNANSMFSNCYKLKTVPLFDTSAATSMSGMFTSCYALESIPLYNTAAATNMSNIFNTCYSLQSIPALVTTAVTTGNLAQMFLNCYNLSRVQAKDFKFSFSVANCKLAATALDEIYTNLPTVVGQTITVTGNPGTTGDNPSIATAKGWTVTG